jgi:hypothetical protein
VLRQAHAHVGGGPGRAVLSRVRVPPVPPLPPVQQAPERLRTLERLLVVVCILGGPLVRPCVVFGLVPCAIAGTVRRHGWPVYAAVWHVLPHARAAPGLGASSEKAARACACLLLEQYTSLMQCMF